MVGRIVWAVICLAVLGFAEVSTGALGSGDYGRFLGHFIVIGAVWWLVDRRFKKASNNPQ